MGKLGHLQTQEPIEKAMRLIRGWLHQLGIDGLSIQTNYDARQNIAVLKFRYNNKDYEFRSTKQANSRLNMHGIARVMEYKVRSHIMGIEDFERSMKSYLALGYEGSFTSAQTQIDQTDYIRLGISPLASNDEIKKKYKELMKGFHPDMALSDEAKKEFEKRSAEINEAWTNIQKERGLIEEIK